MTDNFPAGRVVGAGFPELKGPLPVNNKDLTHQVVQTLRSAIISGRLQPGEFIRIGAAAEALGVSSTPIREALVTLRGDGFVELLPNRGFQVSALSLQDIEDAYLVHQFVAGELAARSALSMEDDDVQRLQQLQSEITSAFESGRRDMVDKANEEFHRLIYANGGSPKLGLILGIALRYVPNAEDANIAGWADATAQDHKDILEAFLERDPARARDAMVAHIEHAKRLLLSHLEAARAQQPQEGFR